MSSALTAVPPEAVQTLQNFLAASTARDEAGMRACLTRRTLEDAQYHGQSPENVAFTLGTPFIENETVIIPLTGTPTDAGPDAPPEMTMECIMVQEDGQWKFDLPSTMERMMGGSLDTVMNELANTMGQAMEKVGEALSEAFGSGDDSSVVPADWVEAILTPLDDEYLPTPEMTPLPKLSSAISEAIGSPVQAEAAIDDLLRGLGSDDRETLINWFEDTLFAGWKDIFAKIAASPLPVRDRLRAIRIEAARTAENRFLAIDCNDLVYRVDLNTTDGYYSDEEIAWHLPAILAGLPETIEMSTAGWRTLHNDDEYADIDLFRQRIVPRYMRRISDLIGRPIQLLADFDDVYDPGHAIRLLNRWGFNRILGAIALGCMDPELGPKLREQLNAIRVDPVYCFADRAARFEDGTLHLSLNYYGGEKGSFYEMELYNVLCGHPVEPTTEQSDTPPDDSDQTP